MVRVGIRVRLALGLQLVSSRFGIILCRLLYEKIYTAAVLCTCDIFGSEINTLLLLWLELDD